MTDPTARDMLEASLATFGADIARWPEHQERPARARLLADPGFRRAWEAERDLDAALAAHRAELDRGVEASGGAERVALRVLGRLPATAFTALPWRRMAAAMVLAGALGGAMDLVLPEGTAEFSDVAVLDPLLALDDPTL